MRRRQFIGAGLSLAAAWPFRSLASVAGADPLEARTLEGGELLLPHSAIEDFAAGLRGPVMLADHAGYDARRRLWNASFEGRPALIACCTGTSDVRRAVAFARDQRLLTAVRSGGHSLSGKSTCDGGLVIDLQSMRGVRVDPSARRAYLEAGSLLGELDHETAAFGLATTAGTVSSTGAAGLTLGGGFGRLGRRCGLACDNVESFDVVTADGRFARASRSENSDLYWGLRGGGGNFGIVTSIEYRLHELDPVILSGHLLWPLAKARDVMRRYRDEMADASRDLFIESLMMATPDGPVAGMEVCWFGDHARGESRLRGLRAFSSPIRDTIGPVPYVVVQGALDAQLPAGRHYYSKSGFLEQLTDAAIELAVEVFRRGEGKFLMFVDPTDGAYHDVAPDATAFPNRRSRHWLGMVSGWDHAADSRANVAMMRTAWSELEPLMQGFYTNLADPSVTTARYRENYGDNLERLVAIKAKYDPDNLFRLNANVPPAI